MGNKKLKGVFSLCAEWLNMASVAFVATGVFQAEHMLLGLTNSAVCFILAVTLKYWSE